MAVTKDSLRRKVIISRHTKNTAIIERSSTHKVVITKTTRRGVEL